MNVVSLPNRRLAARDARYAFVVPRYGAEIGGGAETLVRTLAERLVARGTKVEVLATCAKDNRTWNNEFSAGTTVESGVTVHRFPVKERNLDQWVPKQIAVSKGERLAVADQLTWMQESVTSSELFSYILAQRNNFDAFVFAPYLFGTTFWGALLVPEKSYLIPCLHDESYAYTEVMQSMFRQIAGCAFNALPEMELAQRLFGGVPGGVVGMGFDTVSNQTTQNLRPYFSDNFPYLLYLGRKETGKNAHVLIDHFCAYKDRFCQQNSKAQGRELKLVIVGGGSFSDLLRPEAQTRSDIVDIDHVSEHDKQRILAHALALCQPSQNESFSIVMMEAWGLTTPVLVSSNSPVTLYHVKKSGGGLFFADTNEFDYTVEALFNRELRRTLGLQGKRYVESEYSWEAVLRRFDKVFSELLYSRI